MKQSKIVRNSLKLSEPRLVVKLCQQLYYQQLVYFILLTYFNSRLHTHYLYYYMFLFILMTKCVSYKSTVAGSAVYCHILQSVLYFDNYNSQNFYLLNRRQETLIKESQSVSQPCQPDLVIFPGMATIVPKKCARWHHFHVY